MKTSLNNLALLISLSMLTLVGCSTNTQSQNTTLGAVSGAVVGGLAGSLIGQGTGQVVAIGVGAIAGAFLGGTLGHNMESSDNANMSKAMSSNQTNQPSSWHNNHTNAHYTVTPTSNVMAYNGNNYCRNYHTNVVISGKQQVVTGVACKQSDGTWKTINS
jgi:surface antigen